jgi:signal recognition particle receptor subunit beta
MLKWLLCSSLGACELLIFSNINSFIFHIQRLSGSSLLILANKQDIKGALAPAEIAKVSLISSGGL